MAREKKYPRGYIPHKGGSGGLLGLIQQFTPVGGKVQENPYFGMQPGDLPYTLKEDPSQIASRPFISSVNSGQSRVKFGDNAREANNEFFWNKISGDQDLAQATALAKIQQAAQLEGLKKELELKESYNPQPNKFFGADISNELPDFQYELQDVVKQPYQTINAPGVRGNLEYANMLAQQKIDADRIAAMSRGAAVDERRVSLAEGEAKQPKYTSVGNALFKFPPQGSPEFIGAYEPGYAKDTSFGVGPDGKIYPVPPTRISGKWTPAPRSVGNIYSQQQQPAYGPMLNGYQFPGMQSQHNMDISEPASVQQPTFGPENSPSTTPQVDPRVSGPVIDELLKQIRANSKGDPMEDLRRILDAAELEKLRKAGILDQLKKY